MSALVGLKSMFRGSPFKASISGCGWDLLGMMANANSNSTPKVKRAVLMFGDITKSFVKLENV